MTKINRPFENLTKAGNTSTLEDLDPSTTALVIIDMQNWDAHPEFGLAKMVAREHVECDGYWERVEQGGTEQRQAAGQLSRGGREDCLYSAGILLRRFQ